MRPPSLITLLLLMGKLAAGQPATEPGYTLYNRMDGLSNNVVTGIVQDSLGYVWVATSKGLDRFDGWFFSSFYSGSPRMPLPDNKILDLSIRNNELIGSSVGGAFAYDTYTRAFRKFIIPADSLIAAWTNIIQTTVKDNRGHYILSSKTGLYIFDSSGSLVNRYDHYKPSDSRRIELDFSSWITVLDDGKIMHANNFYFSRYDPAVNRLDTFYGMNRPAIKRELTDARAGQRFSYPARHNKTFVINEEANSIDVLDFISQQVYRSPLPFEASSNLGPASRFIYLNDTTIAVTAKVTGFYIFHLDPVTQRLHLRGEKHFEKRFCNIIFCDREGRLWIGTNDGLYKKNLANPFFSSIDLAAEQPQLRNADVRCVYNQGDDLYVGLRNKGGLLLLNKVTGRLRRRYDFSHYNGESNTIYNIFPYSADTLWIGTRRGVFWVDTHSDRTGRISLPDSLKWTEDVNTLSMAESRTGQIWMSFGRLNSIIYFDRLTRRFTDISGEHNPLLKLTFCFSIEPGKNGIMWFAGDGIARWNPEKRMVDTLITEISVGLKRTSYFYILDMDRENNLWLYSYNNGLIQYNCDRNTAILRKEEGDFSDWHIMTSSPLIDGHIWLGMDNGIASFNIRDYSNRLFTYSDGLPTAAITSLRKGSWYDAGDNVFYLGAGHQLISFHPDSAHAPEPPPKLFIDEVYTQRETFPRDAERIALSYSDNSLQVDFNAVNFISPEDSRFAYRVTPTTDTSWLLLDRQHSVSFSNLAPGKYDLDIKLFSANNRWPDQRKHLAIEVRSPFWLTGWFILLACLAIGGLALVIGRSRIAQVREKAAIDRQLAEFEMKALHAQMNPHFIFNALNSIKEMILHDDNRNASLYLSRFAHLIRLTLEHSRKTFIPLQQQIEYLDSYLQMEQLRFADFSYRIAIAAAVDAHETQIAPMLLQPLVENAIWHGLLPKKGEKQLSISFYLEKGQLVCDIDDNGIGIKQSLDMKKSSGQFHESLGIENIRERMAVLNEKYQIDCSLQITDKSELPDSREPGTLTRLTVRASPYPA